VIWLDTGPIEQQRGLALVEPQARHTDLMHEPLRTRRHDARRSPTMKVPDAAAARYRPSGSISYQRYDEGAPVLA
jgi:hypothetical protein